MDINEKVIHPPCKIIVSDEWHEIIEMYLYIAKSDIVMLALSEEKVHEMNLQYAEEVFKEHYSDYDIIDTTRWNNYHGCTFECMRYCVKGVKYFK